MAETPKPSPPSDLLGSMSGTSPKPTVSQLSEARPEEKGSSLARGASYGRIGVHSLSPFCFSGPLIPHVLTVDVAKTVDPKVLSTLASPDAVKEGGDDASARPEKVYLVDYDTSKAKKIFGIQYKTERECATDIIADFGKRGW
jgi:hypothetical protein